MFRYPVNSWLDLLYPAHVKLSIFSISRKLFLSFVHYWKCIIILGIEIDAEKTKLPCECQPFEECAWSERAVNQIKVLPKDSPRHQQLSKQFQQQICDVEKKNVWCCPGSKMANEAQLKVLTKDRQTKVLTKPELQKIVFRQDLNKPVIVIRENDKSKYKLK